MKSQIPSAGGARNTPSGMRHAIKSHSLNTRVDAIDALLPQTQCTRCGYPRCRDYAAALSAGESAINRCPPGGDRVIAALAAHLGVAPQPLDTRLGEHAPAAIAQINEPACIGCTLCIQVCPTDAIVGAAKRMHTVIDAECSGCELCLPACPVDCITLKAAADHGDPLSPWRYYSREQSARYRRRTEQRLRRLSTQTSDAASVAADNIAIREEIRAAVARTRSRRRRDRR